jgi:hypothetical protein
VHVDDLLRAEYLAAETGDAMFAEFDRRKLFDLVQTCDFDPYLDRLHVNDVRRTYQVADAAAGAFFEVDRLDHAVS